MEQATNSVKSWFNIIAGLTVINTIIALFHGDISFIAGLIVTELVTEIVNTIKFPGAISFIFTIMSAGFFFLFAYFTGKQAKWAMITGLCLYALDTLLMLILMLGAGSEGKSLVFGLLFHLYAIFSISVGLSNFNKAKALESQQVPVQEPSNI